MKKPGLATACLLATITLLGGVVRFQGITGRGPFLWDDAILHLESIFLLDSSRFLRASLERKAEEERTGRDIWRWDSEGERFRMEVGGIPMRHGRPGQNLILVAAMSLLGRVDWAGPACSALFGTLTIPAAYLLARGLLAMGRGPALAAAGLLALLGYHVRFSREGLAEANSIFFVALAVLAYARSRPDLGPARPPHEAPWRRGTFLALAGLATGAAFTIQDRTLLLLPVVLIAEMAAAGPRRGTRRFAVFAAWAALPILAFEFPFYATILALRRHGIAFPYRTYLEQVVAVVANHLLANRYYEIGAASRLAGLLAHPYLVVRTCGPPFALLAAAGCVVAWRRPTPARRFLLLWLGFCWAFLGVTVPLARYASIFLLPLVLLAALAVEALVERGRLRLAARPSGTGALARPRGEVERGRLRLAARPGLATLLILVLAWEGSLAMRIARGVRPGYEEAVAWIARDSPGATPRHVSTQPYVSMVYAGVAGVAHPPETAAALDRLRRDGFRFYLVDLIHAFSLGPFAPRAEVIDAIATVCAPAATFPNEWAAWPEYLFEFNFDTLRTRRLLAAPPADLGAIRIYDLDGCAARLAALGPTSRASCQGPTGRDRSCSG